MIGPSQQHLILFVGCEEWKRGIYYSHILAKNKILTEALSLQCIQLKELTEQYCIAVHSTR
jgi:hypothetical protein